MRIAAYCRVSTSSDEQLESLKNQREFFYEYSEKNGYILTEVYSDEGISGTSLNKRDGFKRLMKDAKEKRFDTLVVKDVSRLARNTVDFLQSIRYLKGIGINTVFLTSNMQTLGESEFIITVFSALAQEESVNLSKRIKFGKRISARKGRVPPLIYGYDRIDNYTLRVNDYEAETVRIIFDLFTKEKLGCTAIAQYLSLKGRKTKLCGKWSAKAVRRILTNPIYVGVLINNKSESVDLISKKRRETEEENRFIHIKDELAIVPRAQYDIAFSWLNRKATGKRNKRRSLNDNLLSGIIKCAVCQRSFIRKKSGSTTYYKCVTNDKYGKGECHNRITIRENAIVNALSQFLSERVKNKDKITDNIYKRLCRSTSNKYDTKNLLKQIDRLNRKAQRYYELYTEGYITLEELKKQREILNKETENLEAKEKDPKEAITKEKISESLDEILELRSTNYSELSELISEITVDEKGCVMLYWRKLPKE